jgi:hypothetical protein
MGFILSNSSVLTSIVVQWKSWFNGANKVQMKEKKYVDQSIIDQSIID